MSLRWEAVRTIVEGLRALDELTGVQVEAGFPGDQLGPEAIWLSDVAGESLEQPVISADRADLDDHVNLTFRFWVTGNELDTCGDRADSLLTTFVSWFQDHATLDDLTDGDAVCMSALPTNRNGPLPAQTDHDGVIAIAEVTVNLHLRMI